MKLGQLRLEITCYPKGGRWGVIAPDTLLIHLVCVLMGGAKTSNIWTNRHGYQAEYIFASVRAANHFSWFFLGEEVYDLPLEASECL